MCKAATDGIIIRMSSKNDVIYDFEKKVLDSHC